MNKKILIISIVTIFVSVSAQAYQKQTRNTYIGIKGGQVFDIEDNKNIKTDDSLNYGIYGGYRFNDKVALEIDYTISKEANSTQGNKKGDYKVSNYGTYLAYRYPFAQTAIYAKGKLGVGGAEIDKKYAPSIDDVGVVGGLGIGWQASKHSQLELEVNTLRSEMLDTNAVTLGMQYQF
ncbi:MAG: porin family protein [Moraxellaceae bacterium]|nr:porin family protein [Moraxellaceae bacterium]